MHIINNPNTRHYSKIMHYMDAKMEKARSIHVVAIDNQERRFEVRLPSNRIGTGEEVFISKDDTILRLSNRRPPSSSFEQTTVWSSRPFKQRWNTSSFQKKNNHRRLLKRRRAVRFANSPFRVLFLKLNKKCI